MNIKNIVYLLCAFISTLGISYYISLGNEINVANNILCIPLLVLYYNLYKKLKFNGKKLIFSIIISIITSISLIIGSQLEYYNDIIWSTVTCLKIMFLSVAIVPIYCYIINFVDNNEKFEEDNQNFNNTKNFIICYGILFFFGLLRFSCFISWDIWI